MHKAFIGSKSQKLHSEKPYSYPSLLHTLYLTIFIRFWFVLLCEQIHRPIFNIFLFLTQNVVYF